MARYQCSVCGYVYDEEREDTRWSDLSDRWSCPVCGSAKSHFELLAAGARPVAPSRAALVHRVFGYVFLAVYLVLIAQMIPRLWTYQIEFPARTVVHLSLGMAVGVVLLLKIAIVRFFRRLDQGLVPLLGTSILVSSVVLIGISVPSAFREAAVTGKLFTEENRARVQTLLAQTGLDEAECTRLASTDSLRAGQRVLRRKCVECHDLRTVLAKPRTPKNWRQTVLRMAERTTLLEPIEEEEQWQVTAYLVAMSPQLQQSTQRFREVQKRRTEATEAAEAVATEEAEQAAYDPARAEALFEATCSQCHPTKVVGFAPPGSEDEARELIARMVEQGLDAGEDELSQIVQYLTETYAKSSE